MQENIIEQAVTIKREDREKRNGYKAATIWLTGLSGAGKSTLADGLEKAMFADGYHTMLLDGDNVRKGLNNNLSFSREDRCENIRRIAEAAKLLNDAGCIVITAFISPFIEDRENARCILGDSFVEVYISTDLETCEKRDVKKLYAKARRGEIKDFTGISSPYEAPPNPEIVVDTTKGTVEESVEYLKQEVLKYIKEV